MPPLAGLKVLELARVLAGPWAGQLLADLGADVVKVESLAGDDTRRWGPPSIENPDGTHDAAYFHSCNRGKRSIAVDFAKPDGREIVRKLAAGADVLVENFKVGSLAKHGLDYASLHAINPRLVYCSITGFGLTGPEARRPGYDFMIQGMGAIMDLTGQADAPPQKVGLALVDIFTGVYAVVAIQAALAVRERTGAGQLIDMSLLDTATSVISYHAMSYLASGVVPSRIGNAHPNIVPYQEFATSDGDIIIAVGNEGQFRRLCAVIGLPALADDPRFADNELRVTHRRALIADLAARIATFQRNDLLDKLEKEKVPAGPINTVAQLFAEPQIIHRGMRVELPAGDGRMVPSVRSPILMSETPLAYERASPRLGEHTDGILGSLGYDPAELARLRAERVVA